MGLGNNSRSPGRDIKVGFLRARERDGGFGSAGAGEWQSQRCWTSRRGERRLGMYLAASRIHTVKCIFPASLLPSSALFPWLPGLGREPSLFQAGETPSTMLAAHGRGLHCRARESRAFHQPPPPVTAPGHCPIYLVYPSLSPQADTARKGNPRGCCKWL